MIQPKVAGSQQLIVVRKKNMIYIMNTNNERNVFSRRLNELCNEKHLPVYGRQSIIRDYFNSIRIKISQESVRKWLTGESIPRHEKLIILCGYFDVSYEWLLTGKGEKRKSLADKSAKTYIVSDPKKQAIIEMILEMDEKKIGDVADNGSIKNDAKSEQKNGTEHSNGTK